MNNQFILLTRLTRRLGFKSRRLKCIWSVSSSAYVRRSRGEFDQILQRFMINPAFIGLQSSLERGGITKNSGFAQKSLNSFTIQARVELQRGRTPFYWRNRRENRRPSDSVKTDRRTRSHDYRGPQSHDLLIFRPSDEATCRAELHRWCNWITVVGLYLFPDLRTCLDDYWVNWKPLDQRSWLDAIDPMRHALPRVLQT